MEVNELVKDLYEKYPDGFVAHVGKGKAPKSCEGLAQYLAKYVASPPIALRRILNYDGEMVTYYYKDHETKRNKREEISAHKFIGRMVEHILPKWFQRIRYYGLQATSSFKKWKEVILSGVRKLTSTIQGAYKIIGLKSYKNRYKEISGKDPFICKKCGSEMEKWYQWHPVYGVMYDGVKDSRSPPIKFFEEIVQNISKPKAVQIIFQGV